MPNASEFLVVDENRDNRFLLTKTLLRKFPSSRIHECEDAVSAVKLAAESALTAVIVHRATDLDGLALVAALRGMQPVLPILAVSGVDRREAAFQAGATGFLHYDAWLSVGRVVEDMLRVGDTPIPFKASAGDGSDFAGASV